MTRHGCAIMAPRNGRALGVVAGLLPEIHRCRMQFELHRDPAIFGTIHSERNALLERGVTRVPFLRAEYQQAWWAQRGGGEWPEAELAVVTARADDGTLVGIAPLFQARNR